MDVMYKNLRNKIRDKEVHDSEIILIIECAKRKDPKFDINWVDYGGSSGWTLLIYAVFHNHEELVEYLLMVPGINVNHKDYDGCTALHYACLYDHITSLKLLLSHQNLDFNIKTKEDGWPGLHHACCWGYEACVKELLLDARVNQLIRDYRGRTARNITLERRHIGIANMIKRTGYTSLLRIPNASLCRDIIRMIIEEYV